MVSLLSVLFALASVAVVRAAVQVNLQAITPLRSAQIDTFAPFTHFASAAYCDPSKTSSWTCGVNCLAVPDFQPVAAAGDGTDTQFWYVGFSQSLNTTIVAHQGTNPHKLTPLLTDGDLFRKRLDASLFPGIPSNVEAHRGFLDEQAKTASDILTAVQNTLSTQGLSSVTVVGHSLGGALALLDGVYLSLQLPENIAVKVISYGMPRVGNQAFADYVDNQLSGLVTHVNNMEDPVPTVPSMSLGYHHPSGEIHIQDSDTWNICPGQDNPSKLCTVGHAHILHEDLSDHDGPYAGITMGCK